MASSSQRTPAKEPARPADYVPATPFISSPLGGVSELETDYMAMITRMAALEANFHAQMRQVRDKVSEIDEKAQVNYSLPARDIIINWAASLKKGDTGSVERSFIDLIDGTSGARRIELLEWRMLMHELKDLYGSYGLAVDLIKQKTLFLVDKNPKALDVMTAVNTYQDLRKNLFPSGRDHRGKASKQPAQPQVKNKK